MSDATMAVRNCMTSLVLTKRARCAVSPCAELVPMLHVQWADGRFDPVALPDRDSIVPAVEATRASAPPEMEIAWIAYLAESYVQWLAPGDEGYAEARAGGERGQVARAFHEGNMSVREALVVAVVMPGGEIASGVQAFRYDDSGQPRFEQIQIDDPPISGGAAPEALRAAMQIARGSVHDG